MKQRVLLITGNFLLLCTVVITVHSATIVVDTAGGGDVDRVAEAVNMAL